MRPATASQQLLLLRLSLPLLFRRNVEQALRHVLQPAVHAVHGPRALL